MLKIIFAGTPEFAVPSLHALIHSKHQVVAVYTQPDRPAGRGQQLAASPVKQLALTHNIPVYQPKTLRDAEQQNLLQSLNADVMVVVAYGLILPKAVLDIPRYGCINVHASLLPRWRGAAPIQRAILEGDHETGVTIMQMDEGLDTGAMLAKLECHITTYETAQSLHDKLAELGPRALLPVLNQLTEDILKPQVQHSWLATYAAKLTKQEAKIDWAKPADFLARLVRAFNPWPVAYFQLHDQIVRVWQAAAITERVNTNSLASIVNINRHGIDVETGSGLLRLQQLQLPGSKVMPISDLLNGRPELFTTGMHLL